MTARRHHAAKKMSFLYLYYTTTLPHTTTPTRGIRTRGSKKVPNPDGKQKIWTQSGWENKNLITVRMGKKKSNHSPDGTAFPKLESYLQSGWEKFSRGSRSREVAKSRTKLLFYFHFYILYFKIIWKNKALFV
jgi:hypothetical protein